MQLIADFASSTLQQLSLSDPDTKMGVPQQILDVIVTGLGSSVHDEVFMALEALTRVCKCMNLGLSEEDPVRETFDHIMVRGC